MKIIEKIMEITGKTEEECLNDCPFNHNDIVNILPAGFMALCNDNGEDCETCLSQVLHDETLLNGLV